MLDIKFLRENPDVVNNDTVWNNDERNDNQRVGYISANQRRMAINTDETPIIEKYTRDTSERKTLFCFPVIVA